MIRTTKHLRIIALAATALTALPSTAMAQDAGTYDGDEEIDEIVVRGVRQQILEAAQIEREAFNVQSVITADDIGQFPDQNIAESLQRLPGVIIIRDEGEGRFVQVRGLPSDFTQVTVNNAQIGSSDPDGDRSVALDVIPSDLLSQVSVNKSLLPDQDHDSLGAKIDLKPLSAFDRPDRTTGRITVQGTYTERADDTAPKISADLTRRFDVGNGEIGLAGAINYFEREVGVDRIESASGGGLNQFLVATEGFTTPTSFDGDNFFAGANVAAGTVFAEDAFEDFDGEGAGLPLQRIYAPAELDYRVERGSRERYGATFVADYKTDAGSTFVFSALYGRLDDNDTRIQQEVELRDATGAEFDDAEDELGNSILVVDPGEIQTLGGGSGTFSDVDIERLIFFQPREEETYALHFAGENPLSDRWTISYAVDHSENRFTLRDGLRGRFRTRDTLIGANWNQTGAEFEVLGLGQFDEDDPDDDDFPNFDVRPGPGDFDFDGFLIIDEDRKDTITSFNVDLRRDFDFGGREAFIAFGYKQRSRSREFLRGENELDPEGDLGIELTLEDVETFVPDTTYNLSGGLAEGALFPTLDGARDLFRQVADDSGIQASDRRLDFTAEEDVQAAYVMSQIEVTDTFQAIVGLRMEHTEYETTGPFDRRLVSADDDDFAALESQDITTFETSYTEWLPHVHLRWEPTDETLVRLSYSRGMVRPSFGEASALRSLTIEAEGDLSDVDDFSDVDPDNATVRRSGGNPLLDPIVADQIDATFGWYPAEHTIITVAGFYKDIKDQIIGFGSEDEDEIIEVLGTNVDPETGFVIEELDTFLNAGAAELYGVELGFSHFLSYLDTPIINGLFVTGNVTLLEATVENFNGETARLEGAAEESANLSLGYEDDRLLIRGAMNYRGDQLRSLNTDPGETQFEDDFLTFDISVRYQVTDNFQVFLDAVNINEEPTSRYYQGDEASGGRIFERFEDFGRTFQFGVVANF
ncbi:MAG: TonB-dependent receptor [Erythrobacter sp.]|jgi:TonB-dependent receptor|nr:TonB-dependent receptor [Erythrobacter sp.]